MKKISLFILVAIMMAFYSCNKDENLSQADQLTHDTELIKQYLSDNDIEAESTSSGLHYTIETPGMGSHPTISSTVTVQYKGYLIDGTVFDSGTATFPLANVVAGWQEGIPKFKKLGRGKLFIPSYLGYGSSPTASIPANSVLIFEIQLISFTN